MNIAFVFILLAPGLRLDDAVRAALENHPALAQASANVSAARAGADVSRSPLLPQVIGRATAQKQDAFDEETSDLLARAGGGERYTLGVTVDQLLWDFGQTTGRWRASQSAARAEAQDALSARRGVLLEVHVAFFAARAQRALLDVARDTLANQERHTEQVEAFIGAGTRPEIDRAQARTDTANARLQLLRAEGDHDTAKARLRQAMGVTSGADFEVSDDELPPQPGEDAALDLLVDEAARRRPELAALLHRRSALEHTRDAQRGGYWPSLGASLGVTDTGPAPDEMVAGWTGVLSLTWRFFEGLRTFSEVRQTDARTQALDAETERLRQQVRFDVEEARLRVRSARAEIDAAAEAVAAARERLRLAEGRYETGVGNIIELGDAQLALANAAAQQVRTRFDLATARARLRSVLGRE